MSFTIQTVSNLYASELNIGSIIKLLISLHICSMWETIYDAQASWSGWKFGSKIPVYPILGFGPQNTSPSPRKLKFRHFLAFYDFSILTSGEYPPPPNWNLGISWHFMTFQFWPVENTPPPPRKLKFRHFLAFYDFSILTSGEYPPPSPPQNWNLGISWHFMTFQFWPVENTPPPKKIEI